MIDWLQTAIDAGFSRSAALDPKTLVANPKVRDMCAANRCHAYGMSWSCPPGCGTLMDNAAEMKSYDAGILVQTTAKLADEFDWEGIKALEARHKKNFETLARQFRTVHPRCLPLSAGTCTLCAKCTYPLKPCRFPEKQFSSMEAYGLLVSEVCEKAGLAYYYGPGTMTFTSCILFHGADADIDR